MHMHRLLVRIIVTLSALVLALVVWISGVTWFGGQPISTPPAWMTVDATGQLALYRDGQSQPLAPVGGIDMGVLPVLGPDARHVALIVEDAGVVVVRVVTLANGAITDVYRHAGHVPQGVQWSPDGAYLAFRVDGGMETVVVPADGRQPAQTVARGAPAYFDWHPDSRHLLIHAGGVGQEGGVVSLYALDTQQSTVLHTDCGYFEAPQWNAAGDGYFYVRNPQRYADDPQQPARAQVVEQYRDGRMTIVADEGNADIRLFANPSMVGVAYIVATAESQQLIYWDGRERHILRDDIPLVAFWAPDGRALATLIPVDVRQLQWVYIDVTSQESVPTTPFVPSPLFAHAVQSGEVSTYTPWSADVQWLLTPAADDVRATRVHGAPSVISLGDGVFGMWLDAVEE